ncbi:hypothetical protein KCG43_19215 [Photobacterium sp. WH24]|uniref:hypothetical protein n=1 Tax=Photobacterium sp. WH24 TaxID=2827237 RepID=UPI001C46DA9E|nr:hypothetical protein [Photobacterium sp. WH24]MBV7264146.1 hypothetical protein [Photobacterium sp. WH24]
MINLSETLTDSFLKISFNKDFNKETIVSELESYIKYVSELSADRVSLYENGEWAQDFELNIESALDYITAQLLDSSTVDTEYSLRIEIDKPSSGSLYFYSYANFKDALSKNLKTALNEVDKIAGSYDYLSLFIHKKKLPLIFPAQSKYNSENIFHRYNFDIKHQVTPEHLFIWGKSIRSIEPNNIFNKLSTYMSLVIFSNKVKREDNLYLFFFNGVNSIALKVNFDIDGETISQEVHDLFHWVFEDTGAVAKISIIRNIFTTNGFTELEQAFSQETIYAIESNHQLYQEDNVKQYFEIKNKVVDFIFSLSNKMSESYDSYYNSNKVNLVAILSYIVTLIVIRGMSKNNFDSTIDLFCYISLAFFIVALIYTKLVEGELTKKVSFYQKQKDELYSRYKNMLCQVELDNLFNSPSYEDAKCKSEEAKFHYIVYGILFIFIFIDIVIIGVRQSIPS